MFLRIVIRILVLHPPIVATPPDGSYRLRRANYFLYLGKEKILTHVK